MPHGDDPRFVDVLVHGDISDHCDRVEKWCNSLDVNAEFIGMWIIADQTRNFSLWKIDDPYHLAMFRLKWS